MYGIYRYINGISLNGGEWLLDGEDGDIRMFNHKDEAIAFLNSQEVGIYGDEEEIEEQGIFIGKISTGMIFPFSEQENES